eukprot:CAMPEP_0181443746 /NCGR_PEP_ID=MMETSP1110-20121109/24711_1 /TAXON_ID=174948 /ORGANISM="Symbiodinium sp., Strain CCMP421" /LENGTH=491 /DNA_ID=CAMNT_0023567729 /DNA_START=24 /DNA_END=1496 /DNA_ORIENTATION=+
MLAEDDSSLRRVLSKRRANTETLRCLAQGGSGISITEEAPGFARPTLSLSTKAKTRRRLEEPETDGNSADVRGRSWQRSRTLNAVAPPRIEGDGMDSRSMHELDAMKSSISEVPLFKQCSPKFVEAIAEQVSHRLFTPGVNIITEGEYGDSMYILHRGEVEVLIGDTCVCTLADGAVFGEIAALCKNPVLARRTATIRAITLCDCRVTYRDSLLKIMTRFKGDEDILMKKLEARLTELQKLGKLPNKKEWWRIEVKAAEPPARAPGACDKLRATLPAISALTSRLGGLARTPAMRAVSDEPERESATSTPNENGENGEIGENEDRGREDFPVWALELACRTSDERTDVSCEGLRPGLAKPPSGKVSRRSSRGSRTSSAGTAKEAPPRPPPKKISLRGSCMTSFASIKADAKQKKAATSLDGYEYDGATVSKDSRAAAAQRPALPFRGGANSTRGAADAADAGHPNAQTMRRDIGTDADKSAIDRQVAERAG